MHITIDLIIDLIIDQSHDTNATNVVKMHVSTVHILQ